MSDLRTAAQQALNYWESASFGDAVMVDKMDALRAALAQQDELIKTPLYTAPPQRKLLPLKTVEKLIYENTKINPNVADDRELLGYIVNAVRAVEQASWEKNHGQA